jgi:hypothetical protein
MRQISVDEVYEAASRMLAGGRGSSSELIGTVDSGSGDQEESIDIDGNTR